jgi:FkbM family methyltransferase
MLLEYGALFAGTRLPTPVLRWLVELTAQVRPIAPYPGWRFCVEEESPSKAVRLRHVLWWILKERGGATQVRLPWHEGSSILTALGNDLNRCLYVGGSYEPNEFALLSRLLEPGMTFVDAGANEGAYTIFAARRVGERGRVLAVEPSPRERSMLEENIRLNALGNVHIAPVALGAAAGTGRLRLADAEHAGQNTLGGFIYAAASEIAALTVDILPLDELAQREGLSRIDVMKIDVEGSEFHLLAGARECLQRFRPVLLLEASRETLALQGSSLEQLFGLLRGEDYELWAFDPASGLPARNDELLLAGGNIVARPAGAYARVFAVSR